MIVPLFWAEGRARHRDARRAWTVRRQGWSNLSQEDALGMAEARAQEALKRILAGENLERVERRVGYNGAAGVPIREEVVSCHGPAVVTRNSYGALCLNVPDVVFADVDFRSQPPLVLVLVTLVALVLASYGLWPLADGFLVRIPLLGVALALSWPLSAAFSRLWRWGIGRGREERVVRRRMARFLSRNPRWLLRLYRTPAGFRILATQEPLPPHDASVKAFFKAMGGDPVYTAMCLRQQCFRARVSPKPWRIGIGDHLKPRPGVWPISPERLPARHAWVRRYEEVSRGYAACRYLDTLGVGVEHAQVTDIRILHDTLSRAESQDLPLA